MGENLGCSVGEETWEVIGALCRRTVLSEKGKLRASKVCTPVCEKHGFASLEDGVGSITLYRILFVTGQGLAWSGSGWPLMCGFLTLCRKDFTTGVHVY